MRYLKIVGGIIVCALFVLVATSASAAPLPVQPTTILPETPLLVTSYQTSNGGTDIGFLEIYNDSDTLQQLDDWTITDDTNHRSIVVSPLDGYIEPYTHVVISQSGAVGGATFTMTGWSHDTPTTPQPVLQVIDSITITNATHRPAVVSLDTSPPDEWQMRRYLTAGYSRSSFDPPYRSLFDDGIYQAPLSASGLAIVAVYPYASTCAPFDTSILCGDYVKIHNISSTPRVLDGYVLRTDSSSSHRTASNTIHLQGTIVPGEYLPIYRTDDGERLSLTNSGGYVWLEDTWGIRHYNETMTAYAAASKAHQGYAYIRTSRGWQWTMTPHPESKNKMTLKPIIATTKTCPAGEYLKQSTGRCNKMTTAAHLTPCHGGQVRNPATNRCRSTTSSTRTLKPCREGYARNPETNRCRKSAVKGAETAKYPVQPYQQSGASLWSWWVIGAVATFAVFYGVWEWRQEIGGIVKRGRAMMTRHRK